MHAPRSPELTEFNHVVSFLDDHLRKEAGWSIAKEYPTAITPNNIHNMSIIKDNDQVVAHALIKPLVVKSPHAIFKIAAIGSVVTSPDHRNHGFSTQNIEKCLELAQKQDCDLAILWTDQFDFYRKLGFELAGFEQTYMINQSFEVKNKKLRFIKDNKVDPAAIQKLYSQHTVHAIRTNEEIASFLRIPQCHLYTAWNEYNQIVAYAAEGKGIDLTNYIHEWGGQVEALIDLFSYIHSEKQKSNQNLIVMCPSHSTNLKKHLSEVTQTNHLGYLGMIKPVNTEQFLNKIKKAFRSEGLEQIVFEKRENSIVFGYGADIYTLDNEKDLAQMIFGPTQINNMEFIKKETREKLATLLPLPLWIWGWDSI